MKHRSALVVAATLAGVLLAGATAVSANIGILGQAESSPVGELSASNATDPQVLDVYQHGAPAVQGSSYPAAGGGAGTAAQEFAVDAAGTVALHDAGSSLRLDGVQPNSGWSWNGSQVSPTRLDVEFTNGATVLQFHAVLASDGTIAARVDQPPGTSPGGGGRSPSPGGSVRAAEDHGASADAEYDDQHDKQRGSDDDD